MNSNIIQKYNLAKKAVSLNCQRHDDATANISSEMYQDLPSQKNKREKLTKDVDRVAAH